MCFIFEDDIYDYDDNYDYDYDYNIPCSIIIKKASCIFYKLLDVKKDETIIINASGNWYDCNIISDVSGYDPTFLFQTNKLLRYRNGKYLQLMFVIAPKNLKYNEYNFYIDSLAIPYKPNLKLNVNDLIYKYKELDDKKQKSNYISKLLYSFFNDYLNKNEFSLYAFANDSPFFYWNNNTSSIIVDIEK